MAGCEVPIESKQSFVAGLEQVPEPPDEITGVEGTPQGTPVDLALGSPAAQDVGFFAPGSPDYVYRFTIESSDGAIPARRRWHNRDPRYLGTFLDFTAPVR